MGVSFKVAKVGIRYRPKLLPPDSPDSADEKASDPDTTGDALAPKPTDREVSSGFLLGFPRFLSLLMYGLCFSVSELQGFSFLV